MTASTHRGLFIAFEGGEGSGKSTQIGRLERRLRGLGVTVVRTREPGPATSIGPQIRQILLDPANPAAADLVPRAEALLFAADRAQHAATLIRPALDRGEVVLTDRYMDSSAIYQGVSRGLGIEAVRNLSVWGTDNLLPDLTVVLDLDTREGKGRATKTEFGQADRIEAAGDDFHDSNRQGFLDLAASDPSRYVVVDADGSEDEVEARVWEVLLPRVTRHRLGRGQKPAA